MEFVRMPKTVWNQIAVAVKNGGASLDDLLRKYRPPVYNFIRNMGCEPEDAEDLTQEVFLRILREEVLKKADQRSGRFRSLLLAVARHTVFNHRTHAHRRKRGGGRQEIRLEEGTDSRGFSLEELVSAPPEKEEAFDTAWMQNLVRLAMERLRRECEKGGKPYFEALRLRTEEALEYEAMAEKLGVPLSQVKNYLHQAREQLRKYVLEEIRDYSSTSEEYGDEVDYLAQFLK